MSITCKEVSSYINFMSLIGTKIESSKLLMVFCIVKNRVHTISSRVFVHCILFKYVASLSRKAPFGFDVTDLCLASGWGPVCRDHEKLLDSACICKMKIPSKKYGQILISMKDV